MCSESGCAAITPGIWLIIDFNAKTLSRCDDSGCEAYPMTVVASGAFINVTYQPGALFKAVSDGSAYLEVATISLTTYTYFGRCQQE